jgi:hypothetical protein
MNDRTRLSRKQVQANLNPRLLIFKALILWSRVDGGTPSLAAAPVGPETWPLFSARAASIIEVKHLAPAQVGSEQLP